MVQSNNFGNQNNLENLRQDRKMMQEQSDFSELDALEGQFMNINFKNAGDIPNNEHKQKSNLISKFKKDKINDKEKDDSYNNIKAKHKNIDDDLNINLIDFDHQKMDGDDLLDMMDN